MTSIPLFVRLPTPSSLNDPPEICFFVKLWIPPGIPTTLPTGVFHWYPQQGGYRVFLEKPMYNGIPVRTQRCFDVHTTSFQRYGRCMDVKTTSCAYWDLVYINVHIYDAHKNNIVRILAKE